MTVARCRHQAFKNTQLIRHLINTPWSRKLLILAGLTCALTTGTILGVTHVGYNSPNIELKDHSIEEIESLV